MDFMAWSLININVKGPQELKTDRTKDAIEQILNDGYEPFSVTAVGEGSNHLLFSFRRWNSDETIDASYAVDETIPGYL